MSENTKLNEIDLNKINRQDLAYFKSKVADELERRENQTEKTRTWFVKINGCPSYFSEFEDFKKEAQYQIDSMDKESDWDLDLGMKLQPKSEVESWTDGTYTP